MFLEHIRIISDWLLKILLYNHRYKSHFKIHLNRKQLIWIVTQLHTITLFWTVQTFDLNGSVYYIMHTIIKIFRMRFFIAPLFNSFLLNITFTFSNVNIVNINVVTKVNYKAICNYQNCCKWSESLGSTFNPQRRWCKTVPVSSVWVFNKAPCWFNSLSFYYYF